MAFTVTTNFEPLPSYPMLCQLARKNHIQVTGNERTGSFSGRGVAGEYEFGEAGLRGKFAGHGVTGEFCFGNGQTAVTISHQPFWLPELLLKQKITEGLDTLRTALV